MTLRTVAVPNPAPGLDWVTTVPGRFLYDVTGITATLTTGAATGAVAVDSSGNARDGEYVVVTAGWPKHVPGLVAGNLAVEFGNLAAPFGGGYVRVSDQIIDWQTAYCIEVWIRPGATMGGEIVTAWNNTFANFAVFLDLANDGSILLNHQGAVNVAWAPGTIPIDNNPHHLVCQWDAGTNLVRVYVDGVVKAPAGGNFIIASAIPAEEVRVGYGIVFTIGMSVTGDECAIYPALLSPARIAAHFAAASVSFGAYTLAVLVDAPGAYYHLDDPLGGPRQVVLVVASPVGILESIPSGFGLAQNAYSYRYSWQPNLPTSTQTPSGDLTTVAIPRLLLPAGYSVGTYTPDIEATDQWSNVTLWWDDAVMLGSAAVDPYAYPPGARLVYEKRSAQ